MNEEPKASMPNPPKIVIVLLPFPPKSIMQF